MNLIYWIVFLGLVVYVMVAAERERQHRLKVRRMRERRQRRAIMDARQPQRWV